MSHFAELTAAMNAAIVDFLADVTVTPAVGSAFSAMLDIADVNAFDGLGQSGKYTLQYRGSDATLDEGDEIDIDGTSYRVAAQPERSSNQMLRVWLNEAL